MKVAAFSSILPLLLVNNASAFAPAGLNNHRYSSLKAEVAELESTIPTPEASVQEEKAVPSEDLLKESADDIKEDEKWQIEVTGKKEEATNGAVEIETQITDNKVRIQPGRFDELENSLAVPFLKRPSKLDGTHAGDIGFDPLGLSESNDMYTMMEAEIRHSRLAMLAIIGWPLSELIAPNWMLQGSNHLAPSVLNGFNPLTFLVTAGLFAGFGYLELQTALRPSLSTTLGKKHAEDMKDVWDYGVPGDYNFDPLNLYSSFGDDAVGRKAMRELEVAHGRGAMMGITYFALWEYLTGHPIVENNLLFTPNLLVPLLGAGYLSFDFFFDIKNDDQYLLQVELSSEGDMRLARLKNFFRLASKDAEENAGIAKEKADEAYVVYNDLKEKYENLVEKYTKNTMKNIN
jgi:hypothetical protein